LDQAVEGLELAEPLFLRQARGERLFLPASEEAQSDLQDALVAAGELAPNLPQNSTK
jgi:hypothetical protein